MEPTVVIDIQGALTIGGMCAIALALIQIGDRLWGNKLDPGRKCNEKVMSELSRVSSYQQSGMRELSQSIKNLADVVSTMAHVQRTELELSKMRYETLLKAIESKGKQ